jgi:hypothetical protein
MDGFKGFFNEEDISINIDMGKKIIEVKHKPSGIKKVKKGFKKIEIEKYITLMIREINKEYREKQHGIKYLNILELEEGKSYGVVSDDLSENFSMIIKIKDGKAYMDLKGMKVTDSQIKNMPITFSFEDVKNFKFKEVKELL